jgi:glucose/arabinose dehydrogenase
MRFASYAAIVLTLLAAGCRGEHARVHGAPADTGTETREPATARGELDSIELPHGFRIDYYAADVPNARSMALSPSGVLFVGTRGEGKVYAIVDDDGDQRADRVHVIAERLEMPNGVAFRDGSLYVAEVNRILRFDDIESNLESPPRPQLVTGAYPTERSHGWKFIAFGPDGLLYVPVGAPCNNCLSEDPIFASITRIDPAGEHETARLDRPQVFARGVRNTVGFDWHPQTGELWFTDNGRDWFGDDRPGDELNRASQPGLHFGYPHCHEGKLVDPELGKSGDCERFVPPAQVLGPHVAALGMRFYGGEMFPPEYRGDIFIAEHGSWNRSQKIGYRVTRVKLDGERGVSYEPFATGWLARGSAWGRPVDVLVMPDGALLVSDDEKGAIYRISYGGEP